ncbi:MAG: hypothetical protein PHR81_12625, partial [Bacteroidales bacterium]|nr:hypothetical protein [Bacteroidales bacterium]
MKKIYIFFILLPLFSNILVAQTETETYHVRWHTEDQHMWGPNGSLFTMDTSVNLFDVNEADVITAGDVVDIFGGDFGAMLTIDYWLRLG